MGRSGLGEGVIGGFFSEVEVAVSVRSLCEVWADLVGDSQTLYVGWSRQNCEAGHARLNDGWFVGGWILSALRGVNVGRGVGGRD